jgi:hypothetical protein
VRRLSYRVCIPLALIGALLSAAPALAVNDPRVPGDECSASEQAVGHPAFANQADNPQGANPPFSVNNPGKSTGARGTEMSQALEHCQNAPPAD